MDNSEENVLRLRDYLNRNKIKLWLAPYINNDGTVVKEELEKLSKKICLDTNILIDEVNTILSDLQSKALENLKKRTSFETTGVATLKVRSPSGKIIPIDSRLEVLGKVFRELAAGQLNIQPERLKLIVRGKILTDDKTLEEQGIKHGIQVMALLLQRGLDELMSFQKNDEVCNSTKRDVDTLSDAFSTKGEEYIQITDQSGKPLKLPPQERKSLVLAMTFHEKGRSAIKSGDFSLALFLLLEAEKEFSQCNSNLLEQVDNYGLLSLDIAWCYLCLKNLAQLPDAEFRLKKCEEVFHKSYGKNLERLMTLKGTTGSESVSFLRLHLLQAIVLYHQNRFEESLVLLNRVEDEFKGLKVDDEQLSQLVGLGYNLGESRIALRESKGNVNLAVSIIENKREERKRNKEAAKKEWEINKEREKLGKCQDGSWVEPQFYKALLSMGYSHETAKWALAQTNNNISNSVALIQEHPEQIPTFEVCPEALSLITAVGFGSEVAVKSLKKHAGNVDRALEDLITNGEFFNAGPSSSTSEETSPLQPSTSKVEDKPSGKKKSSAETLKERDDAYSRMADGISNSEEDHLDVPLIAEEQLIKQYKELLQKI